jgi:thiol-disulfide isomerase/thioredoxin
MSNRAPELIGDTWFGTENPRIGISDFKGRFLLLDFWTLCCVNCHHVLAELRPIEHKFADVLTVVGVHSPKFEYEKLPESVAAGISRHEVTHPVLNDPNMSTWESYGVRAWPTLVLVDPRGDIIANYSGEGHAHAIEALLEKLIPEYEATGDLVRGDGLYKAPAPSLSVLKQPGKAVLIPEQYRQFLSGADVLVSNSGGQDLVALSSGNLDKALVRIGSGTRGRSDGQYLSAEFSEPYGALFVDAALAQKIGAHLLVADSTNHLIRAINLETKTVSTIAGTGLQWMQENPTNGPALEINISTPWDIEIFENKLLIAMAGEHRIWQYSFDSKELSIFAGTTNEGLVDGDLANSWFAQPSALVSSKVNPGKIWIIDAETSALRFAEAGKTSSVIGKGLFDFGHLDGMASDALLQHPLGMIELPDGNLLIADTYNRAVRKYSPSTNHVSTIARNLLEPSDLEIIDTPEGPKLLVVEASADRISLLPIEAEAMVQGSAMRTTRSAIEVQSGEVTIDVTFSAPPGQKLDERYGPSSYLVVSSTPKELLLEGAGNSVELKRKVVLNPAITEGVLHVAAKGASCDESDEGAQCHIHQQDWGIPIKVSATGSKTVELVLSGNRSQ